MFKNVWTSSLEVNDFARIALSLLIDKNVSGLINVGSRDVFSKKALIELDQGFFRKYITTSHVYKSTHILVYE